MGSVAYISRVRVERIRGPLRRAYLPAEDGPVVFGVHSAVAEHYGVPAGGEAERATTLDYIVAAAAGWLTGTFGGALEARHVPASEGRLESDATGEIELEDGVLVIKRIHVRYRLRIAPDIDRMIAFCPTSVYSVGTVHGFLLSALMRAIRGACG